MSKININKIIGDIRMKKVLNFMAMLLVSFIMISGFSFAGNSQYSKSNKKTNNQNALQDSTTYGNHNGNNMDTTYMGKKHRYNNGNNNRTDTTGIYNQNKNNNGYDNGNNGNMKDTTRTY